MDRQRFKMVGMLSAIGAWLGFSRSKQGRQMIAPAESGDEFSHHRAKSPGRKTGHHSKSVRIRRRRSEIAFESRRRNRTA